MRCFLGAVLAVTLLCLVNGSACRAAPTEKEIAKAIRELGDDDFAVRQKASAFLLDAGPVAKPALRRALKSPDIELVARARTIIEKLKRQIPPGTPKDIADLLAQYHSPEDREHREHVLRQLVAIGGRAYPYVLELVDDEEDAKVRGRLQAALSPETPQLAAFLLAEGNPDGAEELLRTHLARVKDAGRKAEHGKEEQAIQNYIALLLVGGGLDARVTQLRAEVENSGDPLTALVLAELCRARDDLAGARQAAEAGRHVELVEQVLLEQRDWGTLARRLPSKQDTEDRWYLVGFLGQKAAYLRLAGGGDEFKKILGEIRTNAEADQEENRPALAWHAAAALLLNDQLPDDALTLLAEHKDVLRQFELLCAQLRFREAFALDTRGLPPDPRKLSWLDLARARALLRLGEERQAATLMEKVFTGLEGTVDRRRYNMFLEAEYRMGLKEQAIDHCLRILKMKSEGWFGKQPSPLWELDDDAWLASSAVTAGHIRYFSGWWQFLRKTRTEEAALRTERDLFDGKIKGADLTALLQETDQAMASDRAGVREEWLESLAEATLAAGRKDLARSYWEKWAAVTAAPNEFGTPRHSAEPFLHLGDLAAEDGRWGEAARWYRGAWEMGTLDARAYYLYGWTLARSGQEEDGRRRMETAYRLPLGNEGLRYEAARDLARREQTAEALREYKWALQFGGKEDFYGMTAALTLLAREAEAKKDFLRAAEVHERVRLLNLKFNLGQVRTGIYLTLSHRVHHQRARGLLAAGRVEEARKEWRLCQGFLPGNVALPIDLVPELEARGAQADADQLFSAAYDRYDRLCADYPRCAWAHHSLAWLAVCCRRRLDEALNHARKAAELQPANAAYLDTLAEVHFQRANKAQAVDLEKRCVALEPRQAYFGRQLGRVEAGDPKAPLPAEVRTVAKAEGVCLLAKDLLSNGPVIKGPCMFQGSWGTMNNASDAYLP